MKNIKTIKQLLKENTKTFIQADWISSIKQQFKKHVININNLKFIIFEVKIHKTHFADIKKPLRSLNLLLVKDLLYKAIYAVNKQYNRLISEKRKSNPYTRMNLQIYYPTCNFIRIS